MSKSGTQIERIEAFASSFPVKSAVREKILAQGIDPTPNTPDRFPAFVKPEVACWNKVIQDAGIKSD